VQHEARTHEGCWSCAERCCGAVSCAGGCSSTANCSSRNAKDFKITANQSAVRAGTEIRVKTERPELAISLSEMAKDSWRPENPTGAFARQEQVLSRQRPSTSRICQSGVLARGRGF